MKAGMTIEEMAAEIMRQSKAKEDYIVNTSNLELVSYDSGVVLRMIGDEGVDLVEPLDINNIAHRQIGAHLNIPAKYYDRMKSDYPDLLTHNVNAWLRREPSQRMVRTLDGVARAFLSNRYRRIDNLQIAEAVLPIIGEMPDARFESCQITDSRMYLKVVNPRLEAEVVPGDIVQAGIVISNSETGQGAVCIQPLVLRLVCMNGMVVNDAQTRRNHLGRVNAMDENFLLYSDKTLAADDRAFILKIQDTVEAAVNDAKFHQVVGLMRNATGARMETENIPGVVKLASSTFGITEDESGGVLQRLIESNDLTLYGLSNAVTRHSQDIEDYDRATKLESIGYDLLTMSRQQWNRFNQVQLAA